MARFTQIALLFLACTATVFAQHRGGGGGGRAAAPASRGGYYGTGNVLNPGGAVNSGGSYGYGNILFPGGVSAFPNGITMPSGPARGVYGGGGRGYAGGHQRTVVVPYAVPVVVGAGYGYGYDYYGYPQPAGYGMAQPATNVTVIVPQQPTPQVIVNPNYTPETANPVMRDYNNREIPDTGVEEGGLRIYEAPAGAAGTESTPSGAPRAVRQPQRQPAAAPAAPTADDKPTIYLIALKDSTVRAAIGYWAQDGTLNYVTPQGSINHVSLDMLDRDTTDQLNRQQGLEFDLKTR